MDVARTSMIHAAASHFLWPFTVQYAPHQLNLQPRVSMPETTPTLQWTGKFYHPTSRRVLSSQDVTFDESVPYYHPLPPLGPAPSSVSQVDALEPNEVAVDSGAARGAEPAGAGSGGAEPKRVEPGGAESWGAEPGGAESGGAEPGGAESGGAERAEPGGPSGASSRREPLSPQQLREWFARRWSHATGAGGSTGAGGPAAAGGLAAAGATRDSGAIGARAGGAAGACAAGGTGAGAARAVGASDGPPGAGAARGAEAGSAAGAGAPVGAGVGAFGAARGAAGHGGTAGVGAATGDAGSVPAGSEGAARPRPGSWASAFYWSCSFLRVSTACPVMALRPSTAPQHVPLPSPPVSSLPALSDPETDSLRAASPTVTRLLATAVTDPSFESTAAYALVSELVDFAAHCRLNYAASLVAESEPVCPPSIRGECALGTDVLEDSQEDFECFATAVPHLVSMLIALEGDPDAQDIRKE
ncbi:unnamed protein product [Closterium sp. NIES-64]|nr:unnamed protein product [Closterium sp. NIES-64]